MTGGAAGFLAFCAAAALDAGALPVGADAFLVNFQAVEFTFVPDGDRVRVTAEPDLPNVEVASRIRLTREPCGWWRANLKPEIDERGLIATVMFNGTYPAACGENSWALGIVRRMRRLSADNAEIGLQLIANTLTAANLIEQRKARDADYSVDGEHDPLAGRRFGCLFLSYSRRAGEPAVQSLIIPPVEYQSSRRYTLQAPHSLRSGMDVCSNSTTIGYGR